MPKQRKCGFASFRIRVVHGWRSKTTALALIPLGRWSIGRRSACFISANEFRRWEARSSCGANRERELSPSSSSDFPDVRELHIRRGDELLLSVGCHKRPRKPSRAPSAGAEHVEMQRCSLHLAKRRCTALALPFRNFRAVLASFRQTDCDCLFTALRLSSLAALLFSGLRLTEAFQTSFCAVDFFFTMLLHSNVVRTDELATVKAPIWHLHRHRSPSDLFL